MQDRTRVAWLLPSLTIFLAACAGSGPALGPADVASLSSDGPFSVETYTGFPSVDEFPAGTIYFPADAPGQLAGVSIVPGFTERQSHIEWWGPRLASHGYAVVTLDTNTPGDRPDVRADALIAAIGVLRAENDRAGSPLEGRIAVDRMAVMGHSMGGGGALIAAKEHGAEIRAAIPFTCWEPDWTFEDVTVPTLVIAGSADQIAPVDVHAWPHFEQIPESTPKIYLEFDGGDHFIADTERGEDLDTIGFYSLAWLRLHVDGDERYADLLYGDLPAGDREKFSRYVAVR